MDRPRSFGRAVAHLSLGRAFGLGPAVVRCAAQLDGAGDPPGIARSPPDAARSLRELLHDAEEALLGGWDPITPLKPHLGPGFDALVRRLQAAVAERYRLPAWTPASYAVHKHADRLAAASEAFHVAGWSREAMRESLGITLEPLADDPLPAPEGTRPWEPWPPNLAAHLFLTRMNELQTASSQDRAAERCRHARPR